MIESRHFWQQFLQWLLLAAVLFAGGFYLVYQLQRGTTTEELVEQQRLKSLLLINLANSQFKGVARDLLLLRNNPNLQEYLASGQGKARTDSQKLFDVFLLSSPQYFQARFLDAKGMEVIRSTLHSEPGKGLMMETLQNKSGRYYFQEAVKLPPDTVYISSFDLNIENGAVERPIRPTLRFALPVYHASSLRGVITLNFNGQALLDSLRHNLNPDTRFWLTTNKGEILQAPNPIFDWSNVFHSGGLQTIHELIPGLPTDLDQHDISITRPYNDKVLSSLWISPSSLQQETGGLTFSLGTDEPWHILLETPVEGTVANQALFANLTKFYVAAMALAALFVLYHTRVSHRGLETGKKLLQSQKLVKELFSNSPAAIYIKDLEGRFMDLNSMTEKILQLPSQKIIGHSIRDLYPDEVSENMVANDAKVLFEGKVISGEEQVANSDNGDLLTFHSVKFPLRDSQNEIIGLGGISMDISELKANEQKAAENEKLFSALFNQTIHSLALLSPDGTVVMANDRLLAQNGHTSNQVIGQSFAAVEWWRGQQELAINLQDLLDKAVAERFAKAELELIHPQGGGIFIDLNISAIQDDQGQIKHLLVEGRNITERVQAERELRRNNLIMSALSYAQSAFIRNTSASALFSRLLDDVLQLSDSEYGFIGEILHHEDGRPYMKTYAISDIAWDDDSRRLYQQYKDKGFVFDNLNSLFGEVIKNGTVLISNEPAHDPRAGGTPEGHPVLNAFLGIPIYHGDSFIGMIGLANRKEGYNNDVVHFLRPLVDTCGSIINGYRANQAEQHARLALRESEQRFRDMLEGAPDAILIVDENGIIELVNTQAKALFGYEQEELIGRSVETLVPPEFSHLHDSFRRGFMESKDPRRQMAPGARELTAMRRDGHRIPVDITLASHRSDQGMHVICSVRDISEKKNIEQHMRHSQKIEAIGQLTGGIAHDFNNLLGIVIGNADLALEVDEDLDTVRQRVEKIIETAEKGADLTRRLLAFSRNQDLNAVTTQVNDVLHELQKVLPRTLGSDIRVSSECQENLWPVLIDRNELESALLNLAINARDAMPQGGKLLFETENVSLQGDVRDFDEDIKPGDYVCVSISDNGSGISRENLARVFEPFFTTKEVGAGTGLGLPMVFGFVKQSKGYIKVYSEVGIGTTIRIYLPRHRVDGQPEAMPEPEVDQQDLMGNETVLVVDDEQEMLSYAASSLRKLGYTVYEAHNGDEGYAMLQQYPEIKLLVSDIVMPGELNGIALGKKAIADNPELKVIFVSGFPKHMLEAKGELNFRYRMLGKPYRANELKQAAREVLDERDE